LPCKKAGLDNNFATYNFRIEYDKEKDLLPAFRIVPHVEVFGGVSLNWFGILQRMICAINRPDNEKSIIFAAIKSNIF
jgi:hypothetical protein